MKRNIIFAMVMIIMALSSCKKMSDDYKTVSPEVLKDKIAGGWAGKMIGVTYGAPTEFVAQGKTFDDSIKWTPADIKGCLWQDDLYVQLTFLMSMDEYGIDAPAKKYHEMFAKAGYQLWHANVQARKNYYDSIFPPASGSPVYNFHADDIDFQIESDYIGFMCPAMPRKAVEIADKIGHIMNFGDGVYGGIFVAALYSEAYFENDIMHIVENALKSIPEESDYANIICDVITLYQHYPANWRDAWNELEAKWGDVDICGAGNTFNIDAKLNGAYIVMGLLYGGGDPWKTLEITTRCGQDSDCNPSNAMAVLGVINGFSKLPPAMKDGITALGDSIFINTNYSFNKAVESTYNYAISFINKGGGKVSDKEIKVKTQIPQAPPLEVSFPDVVFDHKVNIFDASAWKLKGTWKTFKVQDWRQKSSRDQSKYAEKTGDELILAFNGTGIALMGNWVRDGGKADIYIDDRLQGTIDSYFFWNHQEHHNINLWHAFQLQPGDHVLRLVIKGEKRPESLGTRIYVTEALVFKTAAKKNADYKFSFEK
jgi:hypothetical protein